MRRHIMRNNLCRHHHRGTLPQGIVLRGRYAVERRLARTATSAVYLAYDRYADRVCVLKFLAPTAHGPSTRAAERNFVREAKALVGLNGPFPRIYAVHDCSFGWFMVLEYIHGQTLEQILAAGRPKLVDGLVIADQIVAALDYLHNQKPTLVYGDLHPRNVIVRPKGEVILIDLGLTHIEGSKPLDLRGLGVPGYASPEQQAGFLLDRRSDYFALGVLLDELLDRNELSPVLQQTIDQLQSYRPDDRGDDLDCLRDAINDMLQPVVLPNTPSRLDDFLHFFVGSLIMVTVLLLVTLFLLL
jgi:serine/threonine protein kinase